MSRTPARCTQADLARAIKASRQVGAGSVSLLPDGTIRIDTYPVTVSGSGDVKLDEEVIIKL